MKKLIRLVSVSLILALVLIALPSGVAHADPGPGLGTVVFTTAVDVSPSSTGSWQDVDVSGKGVPAGATAALIMIKNTYTGDYKIVGLRNKGSTQDLTNGLYKECLTFAIIGLDSNRKFQAYRGHTYVKIYLIGYSDDITVLNSWVEKTFANTQWRDIDCSAEIPSGSTGAIFWVRNTSTDTKYSTGFRKNGSTDTRWFDLFQTSQHYVFIGVDGSRIAEGRVGDLTYIDVYLVGYFNQNFVFKDNAVDKTPSGSNVWVDIDLSGESGIGEVAFFENTASVSYSYDFGYRKKGSSDDIYGHTAYHQWGIMGLDCSKVGQCYIDPNENHYLVGYSKPVPAPPTNDSLTFTNPYTGNQAVADDSTEWIFQAKVTDASGSDNIDYVLLRLANNSDNTSPYEALMFKWTQSSDTFTEEADTQNCATLTSTPSDSSSSGCQWTLNFKIKFNSNFDAQSTNYNAELYTIDDASLSDEDTYSNFYQVVPVSISVEAPTSASLGAMLPGAPKTLEGGDITVTVNCNKAGWTLKVKDLRSSPAPPKPGYMDDGTTNLVNPLNVKGGEQGTYAPLGDDTGAIEVTLESGDDSIAGTTNIGDVNFQQLVTWNDPPGSYSIVVTFTGSAQ